MAMILPDKVDEVMSDWPIYWTAGYGSRLSYELTELLESLKILWNLIAKESLSEFDQEKHFKALWILGYELSRDRILYHKMAVVPINYRIKNMIEEHGPLLFGFYTDSDEKQFSLCCENFKLVLNRASLWE